MNTKLDLQELIVEGTSRVEQIEHHLTELRAVINGLRDATSSDEPRQRLVDSGDKETFIVGASDERSLKHTEPIHFVLKGKQYRVDRWNRLIHKLCKILHAENSDRFHQAVEAVDDYFSNHSPFFSKSKEASYSHWMEGSEMYFRETDSNTSKQIAFALVDKFSGYNTYDLYIECRRRERKGSPR